MTTRDTETGATTDLIGTVADWLMNQALGEAQRRTWWMGAATTCGPLEFRCGAPTSPIAPFIR